MDALDLARIFTNRQQDKAEPVRSTTVTAIATSDSSAGVVYVDFGGVTISGDDSQSVPIPTTVAVKRGDMVRVELLGAEGRAKTPTATGVIGGGDRTQKAVDQASGDASVAKSTASSAKSVAQTAKASAETAQTSARQASDKAVAAQTSADRAQSTATSAQTSAGQAKATAEQANRTATDAKSTAAQAKSLADNLQTLIRQTSDGLTVGKSADGKTYAGSYVLVGSDGTVKIMSKTGEAAASFEKDMVAFGVSTAGQKIRFCAGHGELSYRSGQIWLAGSSVMLVPIDPTGIKGGDNYIGYFSEDRLEMQCQGQYHIGNGFFESEDFARLKEAVQTDYVTEQYFGPERRNWSWRKWASGLCEQWVIATVNSASGWSRVGSTEIWKYRDYRTLQIKLTALEDVHLDTDWDGWIASDSENPNLDSLGRVYFTIYQLTGSDGLDKKHTVRAYVRGWYK